MLKFYDDGNWTISSFADSIDMAHDRLLAGSLALNNLLLLLRLLEIYCDENMTSWDILAYGHRNIKEDV